MLRLSPWCTQPTPPRAWGRGSAGGRPEELDEQQTQAQQLSKDIRSLRQKPPSQGPSRTACWSGPEATKVHSRARGGLVPTCSGRVQCESHCEAGAGSLGAEILLRGSSKFTCTPTTPYLPSSGKAPWPGSHCGPAGAHGRPG